jgi:hypothetical protein
MQVLAHGAPPIPGQKAKLRARFTARADPPAEVPAPSRRDIDSSTRVSWRPLSAYSEARAVQPRSDAAVETHVADEDNDILAFWADKRIAAREEAAAVEDSVRLVWRQIDRAGKKLAQARLEREQVERELADTLELLNTSKDRLMQASGLAGLAGLSSSKEDWRLIRPPEREYKCGAVMTSHGLMGAYAQSCLGSLARFLPAGSKIVLYINEGTDLLFDTFPDKFPDVEIVHVDDQEEFGGLTGTWNDGIRKCRVRCRATGEWRHTCRVEHCAYHR